MSHTDKSDTASEKQKPKEFPHSSRPLSESPPEADESSLRAEKEAWTATPAPDFLKRPEPSHEKGEPAAASQAEKEPVTVPLKSAPARASKDRRRRSTPIASYAYYTALFFVTAATSAAVVLLVL